MFNRLKRLWQLSDLASRPSEEPSAEFISEEGANVPNEFVSFPCACSKPVKVLSHLMPGEAAVVVCDNCQQSWTVYNPSLVIRKTSDIPEEVQSVWKELSK